MCWPPTWLPRDIDVCCCRKHTSIVTWQPAVDACCRCLLSMPAVDACCRRVISPHLAPPPRVIIAIPPHPVIIVPSSPPRHRNLVIAISSSPSHHRRLIITVSSSPSHHRRRASRAVDKPSPCARRVASPFVRPRAVPVPSPCRPHDGCICAPRRSWHRQLLKKYDEQFVNLFPPSWQMVTAADSSVPL